MKDHIKRFEEILNGLDGLCAVCEDVDSEDLEELNAELEDTLMLLSELRQDEEGWQEELAEILEEIGELSKDYRALGKRLPAIYGYAEELRAVAESILQAI